LEEFLTTERGKRKPKRRAGERGVENQLKGHWLEGTCKTEGCLERGKKRIGGKRY